VFWRSRAWIGGGGEHVPLGEEKCALWAPAPEKAAVGLAQFTQFTYKDPEHAQAMLGCIGSLARASAQATARAQQL